MYVCLCNALTDRDLYPHTAGGDCSVSMVYRACANRNAANACRSSARCCAREQRRRQRAAAPIDRFLARQR
jgi:bacterioferritin-associated ferredoxin